MPMVEMLLRKIFKREYSAVDAQAHAAIRAPRLAQRLEPALPDTPRDDPARCVLLLYAPHLFTTIKYF